MPGSTPEFNIEYPCAGDTIDTGAFQDYAVSTQAAISQVQALADDILRPPAVLVRTIVASQTLVAGASAAITYDTEVYDTAAMFSFGAPTIVTIPENGTYIASVQMRATAFPGTPVSLRLGLLINGVEVAAKKSESGTPQGFASPIWTSLLAPAMIVGDQISVTGLYQGTVTINVQCLLSVTKMANV